MNMDDDTRSLQKEHRACAGTTITGKPCSIPPLLDNNYCVHHNPARRCVALTLQGTPCPNPALEGIDRCFRHGEGKFHVPIRKSRARLLSSLPNALKKHFRQAMTDPNLISVREQIALCETRLASLLRQLKGRHNPEQTLAACRNDLNEAISALQKNDHTLLSKKLANLTFSFEQLENCGSMHGANWDDVWQLVETRRKLSDTEGKNMERAHHVISTDQALALTRQIIEIIALNVTDSHTLRKIGAGIRRIPVLSEYRAARERMDEEPAPEDGTFPGYVTDPVNEEFESLIAEAEKVAADADQGT